MEQVCRILQVLGLIAVVFSVGRLVERSIIEKKLVESGLGYYGYKTKDFHLISIKDLQK
jgi:hypothetical protein